MPDKDNKSSGRKDKRKYQKPKCESEPSFGALVLGCSFTDCGENSAFK